MKTEEELEREVEELEPLLPMFAEQAKRAGAKNNSEVFRWAYSSNDPRLRSIRHCGMVADAAYPI